MSGTDVLAQPGTPQRRIVTTEELRELLASGATVRLPGVTVAPEHAEHYSEAELARTRVPVADNPIVSVEYVGVEEVQCIAVGDEDHLYVTDDFIPTHNTSNIVFLKSTDDSMIETLSKMSGTTHRVYRDSKTVTRDVEKLFLQNEGKVSYTSTAKEEPVIGYNDLAYLPPRNSVVFRAGDPPIWNRNETILPMSWRLFKDTIEDYGREEYSLQTIPTLSSAIDFDVRDNQPDFARMLESRLSQASKADRAKEIYATAYGYDTFDIERLDQDVYADEVLDIIRTMLGHEAFITEKSLLEGDAAEVGDEGLIEEPDGSNPAMPTREEMAAAQERREEANAKAMTASMTENEDFTRDMAIAEMEREEYQARRYANGRLSKDMLVNPVGGALLPGAYDREILIAYDECKQHFMNDGEFHVNHNDELYSADRTTAYITVGRDSTDVATMRAAAQDDETRVYAEDETFDMVEESQTGRWVVHDAFKRVLMSYQDWSGVAGGHFDAEMARAISTVENLSGSTSDAGELIGS